MIFEIRMDGFAGCADFFTLINRGGGERNVVKGAFS